MIKLSERMESMKDKKAKKKVKNSVLNETDGKLKNLCVKCLSIKF